MMHGDKLAELVDPDDLTYLLTFIPPDTIN
jgi:hypothetical protein